MRKAVYIILSASIVFSSLAVFAAGENDRALSGAAESLKAQGVLLGDENGNLNLDSGVTRAEFCKLVMEAIDAYETVKTSENSPELRFSDVGEEHWAYSYIHTAAERGIVNGFGDGTFKPEDSLTYEQAIKISLITSRLMYGGESYPTAYISTAIDDCLLDNVNALIGEKMTRSDAVNLIYNAQRYIEDGSGVNTLTKSVVKSAGVFAADEEAKPQSSESPSEYVNNTALPIIYTKPSLSPTEEPEATEPPSVSFSPMPTEPAADSSIPTPKPGASGEASGGSSHKPNGSGGGSNGGSASGAISQESTVNKFQGAIASGSINPYFYREEYTSEEENIFKNVAMSPLSTFSIDTDTASYSNMRRFIINGSIPPNGSVRSEELINYFDYDLPQPTDGTPFSVTAEISDCPWNTDNKLAMIAVKGEEMSERVPQNLTLLIDVSGSMNSPNKLPLVKRSMRLLLDRLDERDTVSVVTYSDGVRIALDSVNAADKKKILSVFDGLSAGGGTNGSGGLETAYKQAEKNKIEGNNRIILCTDGDFNIGPSSTDELEKLVKEKRDKGIFISVLGFGMGNYKDNRMEIIADKGDGSYYYIDSLREARKVLADEMTSTLYTIAKDVKIQVEFNPAKVSQYRLVGYENRVLASEDFADDKKDAGELGAGTCVVALYEIVPAGSGQSSAQESGLRYQTVQYKESDEMFCVSLRYKEPEGTESRLIEKPVSGLSEETSDNFGLASAAAEIGMLLNDSEFKGTASYTDAIALARDARGEDRNGLRTEFVQLVDLLRYIDR